MSTPILATKLYIPRVRPKSVLRPRLIALLNEGLHRKLTLISAPAGFGKTTLVTEWIAERAGPVAWLSLDGNDGDPIRFLTYFIAALQMIAPSAEEVEPMMGEAALGLLQSPQPPPMEVVLTTLLNEIAAAPHNFALVLDDYHVLDSQPVDEILIFLLDHLPPQMHLVITTREDPPLPLSRYRVRGQMTEIRATDLRFTPAEAAGFFHQVMGLELSEEQIAALEARTEGWIAGLQLAALSMQGRADTMDFIEAFTGSHYFVLDYLVEEVLQHRSEHDRNLLLQTSILERLCGPLCDAVTGQSDGDEMLKVLERDNLFVVPLDDKRQWYRYHHLFAEVLHARLLDEQPDLVPLLHQRASEWFEQNDLRTDAIRHALAAEDFARAADLIELAWPAIDRSFQSAAWLGWVKQLPDDFVGARPVLGVAHAWALLNLGETEAVDTLLQDAERMLGESADESLDMAERQEVSDSAMIIVDPEQFRTLPASIATARTYLAQSRGDVSGSIAYAHRALELLSEEDYIQRGPAAALLGLAHWGRGELEAAYQALAGAMAGFRLAGSIAFAISGAYGLADIRVSQGRLGAAVQVYEQALQLVAEQGGRPIRGTADLYLGLSELYHEQGNREAAMKNWLINEELGEQAALTDWPYRWRIVRARFKLSEGDLDGAVHLLDEAARLFLPTPVPDVRPVAALKTRVWVAQGRLTDALGWVRERGLSVDDDLSFLTEYEHITLVRVLIAQHRGDRVGETIGDAIELLARLLEAADEGERTGSIIEILLLQALAYQEQDDIPNALASLTRALSLAEPEGYVRIFVDEGQPMATLLRSAAKAGIAPDYVGRLRAAFEGTVNKPPVAQSLIEPLSERELDVLRLLRTELSGPEIADELMVSVNTMRTHTKNIYSKLGVTSRRAAVRRAEELDLS